jgi:hypothetical protein
MASVVANIAKGRDVELYNRVNANDPANSALIILVLASGGDDLATLQDYDTVAAVLAGPSAEVTNVGYARKTLTDVDLAAWAPDDTLNRTILTLPLQTFVAPAIGDVWDIAVVAYDPDTTGGTDADLIPITFNEIREDGLPITPDGVGNVLISFANGWTQNT